MASDMQKDLQTYRWFLVLHFAPKNVSIKQPAIAEDDLSIIWFYIFIMSCSVSGTRDLDLDLDLTIIHHILPSYCTTDIWRDHQYLRFDRWLPPMSLVRIKNRF